MIHDNTDDGSTETVDDGWRNELTEHGVDPDVAEDLVAMFQSDPSIVLGNPDEEEVYTALKTAIEKTDLDREGIDNPDTLQQALVGILNEWRDGVRAPPVLMPSSEGPLDWNTEAGVAADTSAESSVEPDPASEEDSSDESETAEDASSVTTFEGEEITAEPEVAVDAAAAQEGIAGWVGPGDDDDGPAAATVEAFREEESEPADTGNIPDTESAPEEEQRTQAHSEPSESEKEGPAESERTESEDDGGKVDPAAAIANYVYENEKERLNEYMDHPADVHEDEFRFIAGRSVDLYREILKSALFPGMTQKERDLLFEKLVDDKIEPHIRRILEE